MHTNGPIFLVVANWAGMLSDCVLGFVRENPHEPGTAEEKRDTPTQFRNVTDSECQ